jgi:methylenetetrahydrofolate reductase (NADPH)
LRKSYDDEVKKMSEMPVAALLHGCSLEVTTKENASLQQVREKAPKDTLVNVTSLPNEDLSACVATAARIRQLGLVPVPHISARRIGSTHELEELLRGLSNEAAVDRAFVIAGDISRPQGPYADALAVIKTGILQKFGVRRIGVTGYPEGHPKIDEPALWEAMLKKREALIGLGVEMEIVTQFSFDAAAILQWLVRLRKFGVQDRVRVGIPGPATAKTLLRFAAVCGVGTSAKALSKYGLSLTRLLGTTGPEALIRDIARALDASLHGEVRLHLFPFGGIASTAEWVRQLRSEQDSPQLA